MAATIVNNKLKVNGYIFYKSKCKETKIHWECRRLRLNKDCRARLVTNKPGPSDPAIRILSQTIAHSHPPNFDECRAEKVKKNLKKKTEDHTEQPPAQLPPTERTMNFLRRENCKRKDYLDWHDFFMGTAFLVAKRSKDPVSQVGACIVNSEKKIVATGYNGMPIGCSDDEFPWDKNTSDPLESKYFYVCHAEMNAVMNKNSADVKNCTIYVGLFPCNECAKIIIQSGIREVIYMSDKHAHKKETIAAKRMFDASGVKYWQYIPKKQKLVIDFSEINWNEQRQVPATPHKVPKLSHM